MGAKIYFLSHEAPTMWDTPSSARNAIIDLRTQIGKPKAVLFVTPHWLTKVPALSSGKNPETIHDFGGFPKHYYDIRYPAPGLPDLAVSAQQLLESAGISADTIERGFDHATWIVSSLLWPDAEIPIVQLSLQHNQSATHHFNLGRALRPLLEDGVIMIASGTWTHNLGEFFSGKPRIMNEPEDPEVKEFSDWMIERLLSGDQDALLDFRKLAPHAYRAHPSPDHILSLFVVMGAAEGLKPNLLHRSTCYGHLAMTHIQWRRERG